MSIDTGQSAAAGEVQEQAAQTALATAAAKNLATTTKTPPQMQGITSRWLLRMLPWVNVSGGTYRVNRRLSYAVGRGRLVFVQTGSQVQVAAPSLTEIPVLRDFDDQALLTELAGRFTQREVEVGQVLAQEGSPVEEVLLIAHGKVRTQREGHFGDSTAVLGVLADGDHLGDQVLADAESQWSYTVTADTAVTLLALPKSAFAELLDRSPALQAQVQSHRDAKDAPQDKHGQAAIDLSAGHFGEQELPGTFVDYELSPREYELSVAQTVLQVHTRVADLYNQPMNQTDQQLKLTVEALRERQEHELVNNPDFGLLANADYDQRISTHSGPPTPDDLDELLSRRRGNRFILAHPKAIAAIGRETSKRGLYPDAVTVLDHQVPSWRGIPIFPCNKIPITSTHTTSILVLRTGEDDQGVVGLHQTGLPDEYQPGLNVRFMGINDKAIISYLVSAYYSAAVLVPDALGVLENVELGHRY